MTATGRATSSRARPDTAIKRRNFEREGTSHSIHESRGELFLTRDNVFVELPPFFCDENFSGDDWN